MSKYFIFKLASILICLTGTLSSGIPCTCSQINEEIDCSKSPACTWIFSKCSMNPNYLSDNFNAFLCSNYPQEECRQLRQCVFHLGKCQDFTDCGILVKDICEQSSYYCVSNGRKCIDKTDCQSYITQVACNHRNLENKFCFWNNQCYSVETCFQLPKSLKTDQQCRNELSHCTVAVDGGCIDSPYHCEQHQVKSQCHTNYDLTIQCFWSVSEEVCLERLCKNAKYKTQKECQEIKENCTSDGIQCIDLSDCSNYKTQLACKYDMEGNACVYQNGYCVSKSCATAPKKYTFLEQCHQYMIGKKCVPMLNGGCKDFPNNCLEFEIFESCLSLEDGSECFWNFNQCKLKECSDAPLEYQYQDCQVWMAHCIGKYSGGCTLRPASCGEIYDPESCNYDSNNHKCFYDTIENKCKNLNCENLKLPVFSNHSLCKEKLASCTFSSIIGGCFEFKCSNILEASQCVTDSSGFPCALRECVTKTCLNAPKVFDNHVNCEQWNSICTLDQSGQGCIFKYSLCSEYEVQGQCQYTVSGNKCIWKVNQCQDILCTDAPIVSYDTHEKCLNQWKVITGVCTLAYSGSGCQLWPSTCIGITQSSLCLIGTMDGESCSWFSSQCQVKNCSNAPDIYKSMSQCSKWLINCTFDNLICVDKSTIQCDSINTFTTHSECYEWNSNCTIAPRILGQGCEEQRLCLDYVEESQCQMGSDTSLCEWDSSALSCADKNLIVCNTISGKDYAREYCESQNSKCTLGEIQYSCIAVSGNCFSVTYKQTCVERLYSHQCQWDSTTQTCSIIDCAQNTTATTDHECTYFAAKGQCSQIINADGTYGVGCEWRTNDCIKETSPQRCNKLSIQGQVNCFFDTINGYCYPSHNGACLSSTLITTNEDCQRLNINCQLHSSGSGCALITGTPTSLASCNSAGSYIQCRLDPKCFWVTGHNCQDSPLCHMNTTATQYYQCQLYHPNCLLNFGPGKGCTYQSCQYVPPSLCDSIVLNNYYVCHLNGSLCEPFACNKFLTQTDCENIKSNGIICYWDGTNCITYPCNQITNAFTTRDCSKYNTQCDIQYTLSTANFCIDKTTTCSGYIHQSSCQVDKTGTVCYWNGTLCANAQPTCASYSDPAVCNYSKQSNGDPCIYTSSCIVNTNVIPPSFQLVGLVNTCSNYSGTIFTLDLCQTWLSSCTANPLETACIDKVDCKQAPKTYTTHTLCYSYLTSCTISRSNPTCVPLPSTCSEATDIQCHLDASGNKCYWSNQIKECITLISCNQINLTVSTHLGCNSILNSCTVNSNLQGCAPLQNCNAYSQDQCYISIVDQECVWYDSQCQDKSCFTADLATYTNIDCRAYFDSTCSLNEIGTKCIISPQTCSEYNQFQCSSPNSMNFYGIPCIETLTGECIERVCENSLSILKLISVQNCDFLSSTCDVFGCRNKECTDIQSSSEEVCQKALPKEPKCTCSQNVCIDRAKCQAALTQFTCNFDDEGQQCVWVNDSCILKTCQTAPVSLKSKIECEAYLSGCIPKKVGGCMESTSCPYIEVEEVCNIDNADIQCNWNFDQLICQYQECLPLCGDGILSLGFEQCDDGNSLPYDGCYKCEFHCSLGCATCIDSQCQQCEIGWRLQQNQCETVCGDGLVIGKEECDDMNEIQFDGCFDCMFQCDQYCRECYWGICELCEDGYHLQEEKCLSKCGDAILVPLNEKCDDGNTLDEDGCSSQCEYEIGWVCIQNAQKITECIRNSLPKMYLTSTKTGITAEVFVSFSQELKFNNQVDQNRQPTDFIKVYLKNIEQKSYQITIKQQEIFQKDELNKLQLTIEIQFLQSINLAILQVQFENVLVNQYGQELANTEATIKLKPQKLLSEMEIAIANSIGEYNLMIIYGQIALSIVGILMGNMEIFWNLLEQLQFLSYLRYINVEYPENLNIFLQIFSLISIQPILDLIHFDYVMEIIHFGDIPFIDSIGKFYLDGINSYFVSNIASTLIVFIGAYLNYLICRLVTKLLDPIRIDCKLGLFLIPYRSIDQVKWRKKILILNRFILKSCFTSVNYFFYSNLIRIYISSSYDILLSTMLQIAKPQFDILIIQISYILAVISFIIILYLIQLFYVTISSPYPNIHRFQSIFENLKTKSIYTRQYHTFQMIKKTLFMAVLVFLQSVPIIQNLVISMLTMVNLIYLTQYRPLSDFYETIKLMLIDFSVVVNTIGLSLSIVFFQNSIIQAWANIAIYSAALGISFGLDIFKYCKQIYQAYQQRQKTKFKQNAIMIFS